MIIRAYGLKEERRNVIILYICPPKICSGRQDNLLYMRLLAFTLSLFLSLWCGTGTGTTGPKNDERGSDLLQPVSEQHHDGHLPNKELLLSSAQCLVITGDENSTPSTVRTHHSNRTQHVAKSPFRHIRDGKVTDIHHHPFLKTAVRQLSGNLSAGRYLYTIRRLRI